MSKNNYVIAMGWESHEIYDCVEDEHGVHHGGKLVDSYTNDDPYYIVMDGYDGERIEEFGTYKEAKDFVERLNKHDMLGTDYCDSKEMYVLTKYNAFIDEWNDMHIYAPKEEALKELIKLIDGELK